jgi:hypothetical protein
MATVAPPTKLTYHPDLEEFLSVKGSATFYPSVSLDVWDLICMSQNVISPDLWKKIPEALVHTCSACSALSACNSDQSLLSFSSSLIYVFPKDLWCQPGTFCLSHILFSRALVLYCSFLLTCHRRCHSCHQWQAHSTCKHANKKTTPILCWTPSMDLESII